MRAARVGGAGRGRMMHGGGGCPAPRVDQGGRARAHVHRARDLATHTHTHAAQHTQHVYWLAGWLAAWAWRMLLSDCCLPVLSAGRLLSLARARYGASPDDE